MTDTLQPNVLAVNPDGSIGANLTAHLMAQGVDLQAGTTNTPPADDRVRWISQQDGSVVADITAYDDGTTSQVTLALHPPALPGAIVGFGGGYQGGLAVGTVAAGFESRTLLDSSGASDFLQFPGRRAAGGEGFVTGTGQYTAIGPAPQHALGSVPSVILVTGRDTPGGALWFESFSRDLTQFYVLGESFSPIAVGNYYYDWLAIS